MSIDAPSSTAMVCATEAAKSADFTQIRYAQCWEDADILLDALEVKDGETCLSIASAGDNSFSLLVRNPAKVIAVDLNAAQLACCALRKAAYLSLDHPELLQLIGSRSCADRMRLYDRCRPGLSDDVQRFWDERAGEISAGIGSAGKFERYFSIFRTKVVPWVHTRRRIDQLLAGGTLEQRREFYRRHWETWRWRFLFRMFFSRTLMGRLGRSPAFFKYVEGSVSSRILARSKHALTELNPADNPYLQWILTGRHSTALPHALRPENFEAIRRNIRRIEFHPCSIEDYLSAHSQERLDRMNLSDIFEYMSAENYRALLELLADRGRAGSRIAYWNMLVPRSRPEEMANRLRPLPEVAERLFAMDKAFFYSRFVVEEVM
jgi:S-adenosylmethionine-diacylglycerol 3-amino-3-carboxypropyl transferase